ncbi:MAG TPA: tetratricopeptide repeat protein [Candidatus Polarisedimenticolaceae bacterium]|nr:tetratricopeptide repeat protein [Candidatus Polarisedimenticolaceae bacterium]
MGFLTHLFYPYGMFLQIAAVAHFFWRRRASMMWLWIIFIGGFVGAAAYLIVEVFSEADILRVAARRRDRKTRISAVEAQIVDNPSVANLEELGELYWDEKEYAKARETFDRAIKTRSDSARTFYFRGRSALELGDAAAAVPDLEMAFKSEPTLDFYRGGMYLARAYDAVGRGADAERVFSATMERTSTPEMLFQYAAFLKDRNRPDEAREWLTRLDDTKRTAPRFVLRTERAWFSKGKALQKQLSALP